MAAYDASQTLACLACNCYTIAMQHRKGLTKESLIAASAAAYVGSWLLFAADLVWRFKTGADARICPVGSQDLTDLCTMAEALAAFLLVFLWALYAMPFAFVLTVIPALALGRFAPILEHEINHSQLRLAQYALAVGVGVAVMLFLAIATGGAFDATSAIAGCAGAIAGAWAFRRARYAQRQRSS